MGPIVCQVKEFLCIKITVKLSFDADEMQFIQTYLASTSTLRIYTAMTIIRILKF